jgi:hypothetical protein
VQLLKGPASITCTSSDPLQNIQGVPGISDQKPCSANFQNITFRGTAPGSGNLPPTTGFGFEGTIVLQFLLANGEHPHMQINPKIFVESLCVRGAFAGSTATCRTSPFWPVSDAADANNTLPTPYLCEEVDARTFGPTDWAVILFDIKDILPTLVELRSLYVVFGGLPKNIYFYPDTCAGPSCTGANVFWNVSYGYLHFRNLKALNALSVLSAPTTMNPPENMDFGFAFTPGAHNENTKITIYCTLRVLSTAPSKRRFGSAAGTEQDAGENTLTTSLQINKQFTPELRSGSSSKLGLSSSTMGSDRAGSSSSSSAGVVTVGVLAAACGVLLVAVAGLVLYIVRGGAPNVPKRVNSQA